MMFFWLPLLLVVPFAILWLVRPEDCGVHAHGTHGAVAQPPAGPDAVEIARMRLARGEITPEQYEEIRAKLG